VRGARTTRLAGVVSPLRGLCRGGAALLLAAACVATPQPAAAQCGGDCDGNGSVAINELIAGVSIALGRAPLKLCVAMDTDGNGTVTIEELIVAVGNALTGCAAAPTLTPTTPPGLSVIGACVRPGPRRLVACDPGTLIILWRCDDSAACLAQIQARTRLIDGAVGMRGEFRFTVPAEQVGTAALLFEASVSDASVYRVMDFGTLSGAARRGVGAAGLEQTLQPLIDPSSEAAIRLLDRNGLQNFTPQGVRDVIAAVRDANQSTVFDGLGDEEAAALALAVALADPTVLQVLAAARFTPTPTETEPATPTATATATATSPTATASAPATGTSSPVATSSGTASPTATAPTPTITVAPTSTSFASPTATATGVATATRTATATLTGIATATRTATATLAATATSTASPTATRTNTPAGTNTRTATRTATAPPSPTATRTATSTRTATPTRTITATPSPTATRTSTRSVTPTRTATVTRTATATRTVTATPTVTPTRTVTLTPAPFLSAQISTDRGCIETAQNPVYVVGESLTVLFRIDGFSGGPIAQAAATILDVVNGNPGGSIDLGMQPTGDTLGLAFNVSPPLGTETLVLTAQAAGLEAQAQCSFSVTSQPQDCATACDCTPGQRCVAGSCVNQGNLLFCCTGPMCPAGADCQEPGGAFGMCPP
jgi:hypothetical protein